MTAYVISPHLDDAVLSLGQTIAAYVEHVEPVRVVTIMAGVPHVGMLSDYDKSTGFANSNEAMIARRHEDKAALAVLGAEEWHWHFFDRQYEQEIDETLMRKMISKLFTEEWPDRATTIFAPLGLGHPDHDLVARAVRSARPERRGNELFGIYLYEELPYRVLAEPKTLALKFHELEVAGWKISDTVVPLAQGSRDMKAAAIEKYASQFPTASDPCLFVPERVWSIWREED